MHRSVPSRNVFRCAHKLYNPVNRSSIFSVSSILRLSIPKISVDAAGGQSVRDCRPCPKGTYGDTQGLTTRECSGRCSDLNTVKTKFYGISEGLTSKSGCIVCREGYLDAHGQCDNKKAFMERYTKE